MQEFLDADTAVIGAPVYNFTIPNQLKAWIDWILVTGVTFRYGASGPEGLVKDKRVVLAPTRGGFYGQCSPTAASDRADHPVKRSTLLYQLRVTDQIGRATLQVEGDIHIGISLKERRKFVAEDVQAEADAQVDLDGPGGPIRHAADVVERLARPFDDVARTVSEGDACGGQRHIARGAVKQACAQGAFKPRDAAADVRLGQAQRARRLGEAMQRRHALEHLKIVQVPR